MKNPNLMANKREKRSGDHLDESDEELMRKYGISVTEKKMFTYKNYKYERLADAVNYAILEQNKAT